MRGAALAGVGLLTGWGPGAAALPPSAARAAEGPVVRLRAPDRPGERFRRATRECCLGVAAMDAALAGAGLERDAVRGSRSALVYVTAAAYGSANRAFVETTAGGTLHFPYTAPSAVPAEAAIEFGLTGAYVILVGGPAATIDALWQAATLLARGAADRALVLAVETFAGCEDLWGRGRWLVGRPLVEAAACAVLVPGPVPATYGVAAEASALERVARARGGETLACGPLLAAALGRAEGADPVRLTGEWRGRRAGLDIALAGPATV